MEFQIDGANFDNIAPAKVAETGTYKLALTRKEIKENKAGDSNNFEFDLMVIDDPAVEGITFTIYQALPKKGDEDRMTRRAQSYKDMKQDMLKQLVERFGGSVVGSSVKIPDDVIVTMMIEKKLNAQNEPYNVPHEETIKPLTGGKVDLG